MTASLPKTVLVVLHNFEAEKPFCPLPLGQKIRPKTEKVELKLAPKSSE